MNRVNNCLCCLWILVIKVCMYVRSDDIIVVGAGIAGCTAARTVLRNSDHNVIVLEANPDRYGGRMWTRHDVLSNGAALDLGASWIHGANLGNPIYRIALKLGLPTYATNYFDANIWNMTGSQYDFTGLVEGVNKTVQIVKTLTRAAEDYEEDISVYDAIILEELYDIYSDPMQLLVMSFTMEGFWAAPIQNISVKFMNPNDGYYGPELLLPSGYTEILNSIVEGDQNETILDIRLGQEVTAIEIDDVTEQAVVTTASGDTFIADSVIVTVPLGVLKEGNILFSPPLPEEKTTAIRELGFGNYNKFVIEFASAFWDENITMLGVTPTGETMSGMMSSWLNLYPVTGVPALMTFMDGDEAYIGEDLSEEQLLEIALQRLSNMYGSGVYNQTIVTYLATRWFSDPFVRGTWSYGTIGNDNKDWFRLSKPVCPSLYFAGEHTAYGEYGNVHSGYTSGERAALEIINGICNEAAESKKGFENVEAIHFEHRIT